LVETTVQPGEVYFVPAGTVHAIGAGVLLYEIQQASDVTWRLFDWGRPREIHVDAAIASARPRQFAAQINPLRVTDDRDVLVACRHFALERVRVNGRFDLPSFPAAFRVLTVLDGDMTVAGVQVRRGATAVLPADLPEQTLAGRGSFLLGYIPDLEHDVRRPLLEAGHSIDAIRRIGADL
jgi:mannose-6-phosphate isomerase